MVEVLPRKGMIVKPVSLHDVLEIIEIRLVNESYCVRLAAERADRGELEAMAEVLTRARKATRARNIEEMMLLDREFHTCLARASALSLRGASGDEAISFSDKDCFAEFILSVVEGLAMTRDPEFADAFQVALGLVGNTVRFPASLHSFELWTFRLYFSWSFV